MAFFRLSSLFQFSVAGLERFDLLSGEERSGTKKAFRNIVLYLDVFQKWVTPVHNAKNFLKKLQKTLAFFTKIVYTTYALERCDTIWTFSSAGRASA